MAFSNAGQIEIHRHAQAKAAAALLPARQRRGLRAPRPQPLTLIVACAAFNASVWFGLVGALSGSWTGPLGVAVAVGAFLLTIFGLSLLAVGARERPHRGP